MKKVLSTLAILFGLSIGCTNTSKPQEESTTASSTETTSNEQTRPDFNSFWSDMQANKSDVAYIQSKTDFPIYHASSENRTMDASNFENIFERLAQEEGLKIGEYDGQYINGYLKENFIKKYGDLVNVFVVASEPTPIGHLAYFKQIGNDYKFIGFEILENAE